MPEYKSLIRTVDENHGINLNFYVNLLRCITGASTVNDGLLQGIFQFE